MSVDCHSPEGLPGSVLKIAAEQVQSAAQHAPVSFKAVCAGTVLRRGISEELEPLVGIASAGPGKLRCMSTEMIAKFVTSDRLEPSPKTVAWAVTSERSDSSRDGPEHLLPNVSRIGILQPHLSRPSVDERPVKLGKPAPRIGITCLDAIQEARRRRV